MKILINENNIEKITSLVNDVQKKTSVRNLETKDIYESVENSIKKLNIPKKYLDGITVWCDIYAQDFPKAYYKKSYVKPYSTQFGITFSKGKAYLTDIVREKTGKIKYTFELTEIVKNKIIENFVKNIQY